MSHVLRSRSIDITSNNHFVPLHPDPVKHDKLLDLFFRSILQLVPGQIPHVFKVVCSEVYSISGVYVLSFGAVMEEAGGKRYPRYKREDKAEQKNDSNVCTSYWLDMDVWSKSGGWVIWRERTHRVDGLQYESTILAYDTSFTCSLHPGFSLLNQWAVRKDVRETYEQTKYGPIIAMRAVCGSLSMERTKTEDLYSNKSVRGLITSAGKPKYLEGYIKSCPMLQDETSDLCPDGKRDEVRRTFLATQCLQDQNRRCCEMHKQPGFTSSDKNVCCFSYIGFKNEEEYKTYRKYSHLCNMGYPGCLVVLDQVARVKITEFYKNHRKEGHRVGTGFEDLFAEGLTEV